MEKERGRGDVVFVTQRHCLRQTSVPCPLQLEKPPNREISDIKRLTDTKVCFVFYNK